MTKRFFSSSFLMLLFVLSLFLSDPLGSLIFVVFGLMVMTLSICEAGIIFAKIGSGIHTRTTIFFSAILFFSVILAAKIDCGRIEFLLLPCSAGIGICAIYWLYILFAKGSVEEVKKIFNSISLLFMFSVPLICLALIYFGQPLKVRESGKIMLFFMALVTKSGDIGGYIGGKFSSWILKGKNHKMIPSISPMKSWEGTGTGLVFSITTAIVIRRCYPEEIFFSEMTAFIIGGGLYASGLFGDLAESVLKRVSGIKDSGIAIPGIGGMLDLIDSFLVSTPLFYLYLLFSQ